MRLLMTVALLALGRTAVASTFETDINLSVAGLSTFKTDPAGGTISASSSFGVESAQGLASMGALGAKATALSGAINDTALVEFLDNLSFIGSGSIGVSQILSGSLIPTGPGTAFVIGKVDVTGPGFLGLSTTYQKTVSTISASFEFDNGPLVIPVTSGQSLSVLSTMLVGVAGSATADYISTDHVYITALTPGLQIVSASGHDYSPPGSVAAVPEPLTTLPLLLFGGLLVLAHRRHTSRAGAKEAQDLICA
jgi:hypothetical protein